jgi:hypothetical protein
MVVGHGLGLCFGRTSWFKQMDARVRELRRR